MKIRLQRTHPNWHMTIVLLVFCCADAQAQTDKDIIWVCAKYDTQWSMTVVEKYWVKDKSRYDLSLIEFLKQTGLRTRIVRSDWKATSIILLRTRRMA
jgi:hypothetical protein